MNAILIAGAGPVGLSAALTLCRFGVPVRIIDQNEAATTLSKALVLWRRSLIELDPVIPVEEWVEIGLVPKGMKMCDQGAYKATMSLENEGHEFPHGLLIPQSDVEAKLIAALARYGVQVERKTSLDTFVAKEDRVICTIHGERGRETFETPYLFGCDGAHSTVRHTLQLPFPGESLTHRWLLGDVEVQIEDGINPHAPQSEAERTVEDGFIYSSTADQGALMLFPIQQGRYRLFAESGVVTAETPRHDPTLEDLQEALIERTRLQWKITSTHWLAEFRINERQVEEYVHGRVFVAGDAAHVHSPAGGQGMNTGIQDAVNLAWKVALTEKGASQELIPTYQEERHPVAARVLRLSARALRMGMSTNRLKRGVQDIVLAIATHIPQVRKAATAMLAEDDIAYIDSTLGGESDGKIKAGHTLPDVPIERQGQLCSSIHLLRPTRADAWFTLILMPETEPDQWPSHPLLQIHRYGRDFTDPRRAFHQALDLASAGGVLIRPDGVVAASGGPGAIQDWIDCWLG